MSVSVPTPAGDEFELDPTPGRPIVIVGPNGSGKSALSVFLHSRLEGSVNRIFAHRRIWMSSPAPEMSPSAHIDLAQTFDFWDMQPASRWRVENESGRLSSIINDVLNRQNYVNHQIAEAVRNEESLDELQSRGPLEVLNDILEASALGISIGVAENGGLLCHGRNGTQYSAAEMSDGEKAALLLVSDVLVADQGSIHLIDEPERHLHRSISASLITSLIERRTNDSFIVFTHDLELATYLGRGGATYVLNGCRWQNGAATAWQIEEVPERDGLPDEARRAILGGRSKVLFHEGVAGGLDQELYEALMRGWTVTAVGGCSDVIRATAGLNNATGLHWIEAKGVIDKDFRNGPAPKDVVVLNLHEVENIFYHSTVIKFMANMQSRHYGADPDELIRNAYHALKNSLTLSAVRAKIVSDRATQELRDELSYRAASVTSQNGGEATLSASVDESSIAEEYDRLLATVGSIDAFLTRFPIRESPARTRAASALRFLSPASYESAVVYQIRESSELLSTVLAITGLEKLH